MNPALSKCITFLLFVTVSLHATDIGWASSGSADETRVLRRTRKNSRPKVKDTSEIVNNLGSSVDESRDVDFTRPSGTGFSIFAGVDLGYVSSSPTDPEVESEKSGYNLGFKGIGSIFTNAMIFDIGGGFLISNLSGARDTIEVEDEVTEIRDVSIETRIGYMEFSPRVRIGRVFSLGLIGQAFFGEDGRFGPENPLEEPDNSASEAALATGFAGASAAVEWMGSSTGGRLAAQVLTDINILDRQILIAQLSLQVGLPIIKQKTFVRRRRIVREKERVKQAEIEKIVEEVVVQEVVRFQFDSQYINFETGSSNLSQRSRNFLKEVATFLMQNAYVWGQILIDGHTDVRGTFEYNMNLSRQRASAVRDTLIQSGVPASRIRSAGYGFTRPLDKRNIPVAWARNRRVEMTFSDVSNPVLLRKGIENIRRRLKGL